MSSSINVSEPNPFKVNEIWKFFSLMAHHAGADSSPLGPFVVIGDCEIKREERDIPVQRFLILKPEEGCHLPFYEEYAVEYPEKLIAGNLITFERRGSSNRIRVELTSVEGFKFRQLRLKNHIQPVLKYVLYEEQVEGTWIPIEVDGDELRP